MIGDLLGYGIIIAGLFGGLFNIIYGVRNLKDTLHCYFFFKGVAVLYFAAVYSLILFNLFGMDIPITGRMFVRPAILTLLIFILTDIWLRRKKYDT